MRKNALIALIVMAVLIGTVIMLTSVERSKSHKALADYKAKLRAQGEKLTFEEAGYPFVLETNANLENFIALADRLRAKSDLPAQIEFAPNASTGRVVSVWAGGDLRSADSKGASPAAPTWDELSEDMKASAELLAEIRIELESPPRHFGWTYTNPFAANAPKNPFVQKRKVAQFLSADCLAALHEHDLPRAQTNLHALTQLMQVHRDDWTLVSAMIRVAISGLGLVNTWQALQAEGWDDASLAKLQRDWEQIDLIAALEAGFGGEKLFGQQAFALIRSNDPAGQDQLMSLFGRTSGGSSSSTLSDWGKKLEGKTALMYWRGHMDEAETFYLRDSISRLQAIRRLKTDTSGASLKNEIKAEHDALVKELDAPMGKYRHLFSAIAIPNFQRSFDIAVQRETQRRMTITAIALKRFQLRHGNYPTALSELTPQFLTAELIDAWSGKPFHYQLNADGTFTLYSVGSDGRDDGGDSTPPKNVNFSTDIWPGKDVLWPTPALPDAPVKN